MLNWFLTQLSTPAMSSNEALSYLLTGRSIDTLQSGEVQALDTAAESLAISGGGLLLGGIGSRLGLDEVSVESTGDDDTEVVADCMYQRIDGAIALTTDGAMFTVEQNLGHHGGPVPALC